jgi:DNA-binding CsgD family transcriptional regulator/tetratricopeptide (TPR) repeat protein
MATSGDGIFVGRQREMGELKAALEDALSGQGRLVMLVGEPGIGKTRTTQEVMKFAALAGAQALWGNCYEGEGAPPYWPWIQIIRSYVQGQDANQLLSQMGPGAADIAALVPSLREALPSLEPPPALEPEQARFRLFDSIVTFLKKAAQSQPLVLALDNLHWADQPSLLLLEFLAQQMTDARLLVLGTCRDTDLALSHSLVHTLGELTRQCHFRLLQLGCLGLTEVEQLIAGMSGFIPAPGLMEAVYTRTEGNPLFMTEVVRWLVQQEAFNPKKASDSTSRDFPIPAGIHAIIRARLDHLSGSCHQTLITTSVVGREFELALLEQLMDSMSKDRLLEALEEALVIRVIEELPTPGCYQFTHILVRDTLLGELSRTRQALLHGRIGQALEGLYGEDVALHASEVAYHYAEASSIIGPDKLVQYSLLAGEEALKVYAHEEALAHFQQGLTARGIPLTGTEPAPDAKTAELLFGLGRAQAATAQVHQMQEAIDTLSRAFDYYAKAGDTPRAVAVAEYPFTIWPGYTRANELIARALKLVPPDSPEAGRLFSRYGYSLFMELGDFQNAREAFSCALTIARQKQDAALEMQTLALVSFVEWNNLRLAESLEKSLCAIELSHLADTPYATFMAHLSAFAYMWTMGDLKGMRQHAGAALSAAERLRDRYTLGAALWLNELVNLLEGNWQAAQDFSERGLAVTSSPVFALCNRAKLEYEVGNFLPGDAYLGRLLESINLAANGLSEEDAYFSFSIPAIARITNTTDHFDDAQKVAEAILASPYAFPFVSLFARAGLALMAVQRGNSRAAMEQYAALEAERSSVLYTGWVCLDHLLGLLSTTQGRFDQAMVHFEDAMAFCRRAGHRPELAWTCYDYADTLLVEASLKPSPTPENQAKATSLLQESLAISSELGMKPLMQRVTDRLELPESRPVPAYPDGLTEREVEVLSLIAQGKSNPEIAAELSISLNTVTRHLNHIFAKIGTNNRTEAAVYAIQHGLV